MKKLIKSIMILLIAVFSLLSFPNYALAEEDLLITNWTVDAYLQENGDLWIAEDITFEFKDKFNGVYRDIVLEKTSGVSDILVAIVNGGSISDYSQVTKAKNGDQDVFTLEEKNNKLIIKIFSPSKDEIKTFRISYLVKDVAIKYKDTGELYYKFLGNENVTSIESFIVNINLPSEDNSNKVKVFAHGPLNGRIDKINNKLYRFKVEKVPSKTFIEGRLLFPTEYIAESKNIHNIDKYQDIIDEEAALQTKIEQDRLKREASRKLLNNITLAVSGISILAFAIALYQSKRNINKEILNIEFRDIPEDCTPAVASYITGMFVGSNIIFATILDLFRKGYLRIRGEDEAFDVLDNDNFVIHKTKNIDMSLIDHERYFMNWLFDDMGNGEEVSTNDIKYYNKHSVSKSLERQSTWKKKVKAEADKLGYYDHSKSKQGTILIILSLVSIILGIVTAVFGSMFALLNFALGTILLIYGISLFYRLSDKGYIQYKKWMSFKKYMMKHKPDLSKEEALDSLDPTLIYALSLNVINKQRLSHYYDEAYTMNSWVFWYIIFASGDNNSFNRSIRNSFVSSSSSSSSGSFSGGGGGGAGGGGAGGF
ncbi:MAG: DUF2207 domain-containing protein [Anaerolineaceae bacterium]|nr:MAG: DUF2207 domain-containing protein [Anaerolineaceae bacterium]